MRLSRRVAFVHDFYYLVLRTFPCVNPFQVNLIINILRLRLDSEHIGRKKVHCGTIYLIHDTRIFVVVSISYRSCATILDESVTPIDTQAYLTASPLFIKRHEVQVTGLVIHLLKNL